MQNRAPCPYDLVCHPMSSATDPTMGDMHSPTHISVGDLLPVKGSQLPKGPEFAKNGAYYFLKTAECAPFGLIRHKADSEKCANRPYWMAKLLLNDLEQGELKRRPVLRVRIQDCLIGD
jgi:hypothetical protein